MARHVLLVLLSIGCSPSAPASDVGGTDGGACYPVARVCVTDGGGGGPAVNATVTAARMGEIPFMGRTRADGCAELDLTEGTWQVRADTETMCQSAFMTLVVPSCGTVEATLLADLCAG